MCLLVIAWQRLAAAPLVLVGNRDELHARPTEPMAWWSAPAMLAGRDLQAGGTWLGVARDGRYAVVTNIAGSTPVPNAPSRGLLIPGYLSRPQPPAAFLGELASQAQRYTPFCLLAGDGESLGYYSSREPAPRTLAPGVYGLGNFGLDTPEPKLVASRARLEDLVAIGPPSVESLLALMADTTPVPDGFLTDTGRPREWERRLLAPFVIGQEYGTRCTTALIAGTRELEVAEQSFDAGGRATGRRSYRFEMAR
jgi:uncharacterized protein with NRDE domain